MKAITEAINNNQFSLKTNDQHDYWIHYINYVFKKYTDKAERYKYYMKNFKEKIMIACLDVLSEVEKEEISKQKKFTNKCIVLGNKILKLLEDHSVLKESDKLGNLLFA